MFTKRWFLFGTCFVMLINTVVLSNTQKIKNTEILQNYKESFSYLKSISMKLIADVDSNTHEFFPQTFDFIFRLDQINNRAEWNGKFLLYKNKNINEIDRNNSEYIKDIADGNMYIGLGHYRFNDTNDPVETAGRFARLQYNYKERLKVLFDDPIYGGPIFGNLYGSNHKSVADLLGDSPDFHINEQKENINGVDCFVLEGTSKYGRVTAWIADVKGYSPMKWIIEKSPVNFYDNDVISSKWPEIEGSQAIFEVKEFHEIVEKDNKVFIPKLAYFTLTVPYHNGKKIYDKYVYVNFRTFCP